jgi:hypothetical protein
MGKGAGSGKGGGEGSGEGGGKGGKQQWRGTIEWHNVEQWEKREFLIE